MTTISDNNKRVNNRSGLCEATTAQPPQTYLPAPLYMEAALEQLAQEAADSARRSREAGDKPEAAYFQRWGNAYTKALAQWRAGVRPEQTANGNWFLPSSRAGEAGHLLRLDGCWVCTCSAGATAHWASAMLAGMELAFELMEAEPQPAAPAPLDDLAEPELGGIPLAAYERDFENSPGARWLPW